MGAHVAEDAFGGIGGGVAALAEELFEVEVIDPELLLAVGVVENVVQFAAKVFGGELVLDQFLYDQLVHDQVDEGDVFYLDQASGYLVRDGAAFVADDFGHSEERGFECGGAGGDTGCLCGKEQGIGLVTDRGDIGVGGQQSLIERRVLAGGLSYDELVVGEEAAGLEHDGQLFEDLLFTAAGEEGDDIFLGGGGGRVGGRCCGGGAEVVNRLDQGMTYVFYLVVPFPIKLLFEGEDDQHFVDVGADLLNPVLLPGPDLW